MSEDEKAMNKKWEHVQQSDRVVFLPTKEIWFPPELPPQLPFSIPKSLNDQLSHLTSNPPIFIIGQVKTVEVLQIRISISCVDNVRIFS